MKSIKRTVIRKVWNFERFSVKIPAYAVETCTIPGQDATKAVKEASKDSVFVPGYWMMQPGHEQTGEEAIRAELREYGAWNDEELSDDTENWNRIVWIAAGNTMEERGGHFKRA